MNVKCPHCSGLVENDGSLAGTMVKCPHCAGEFQMPVPVGVADPDSAVFRPVPGLPTTSGIRTTRGHSATAPRNPRRSQSSSSTILKIGCAIVLLPVLAFGGCIFLSVLGSFSNQQGRSTPAGAEKVDPGPFAKPVITGLPPLLNTEFRSWRDKSGRHSIEAQFLGVKAGKANLLERAGRRFEVPLDQLCEDDQQWINKHGQDGQSRD